MSHNKKLDGLLAEVRTVAEQARSEEEFAPAFALTREFIGTVGPIKYDNTDKWYVTAGIALVAAIFGGYMYFSPSLQRDLGLIGIGILAILGIALVGMLVSIGTSNGEIEKISDLMFRKDVAFDNRLENQDIEGREKSLYHQYRAEFADFRDRGDENRYVAALTRGQYEGPEFSFSYEHYRFHYVRVYYVMVYNHATKSMQRQRRTETLYRHGLVLDFPFARGIAAVSDDHFHYPQPFDTGSEDFARAFSISANEELAAAKFFKPAIVLAFLELRQHFTDLNLEVNPDGRLNLSFKDDDVLDLQRKHSLAEPDAFEEEINSHLGLGKLRLLQKFVETLKKHNDSNFSNA